MANSRSDHRPPRNGVSPTRRDFLLTAGLLAAGSPFVRGAQRWIEKKPAEWSPADIQTILNRSAWVREAPLEIDAAVTGAGKQTKPRLGYSTEFSIVVRWESGLPLRLARRTATSADEIPDRYVVSVGAVPLAFLGAYAGRKPGEELSKTETAAFLAASTFIQRGEKGAIIRAEKAEWLTSDFSPRVNISFPRGQNPIELRDGDVVVAGHIDTIGFKVRFALKPMVYRGKLEL